MMQAGDENDEDLDRFSEVFPKTVCARKDNRAMPAC
jgi:hypothetical protein